MSDYDNPINKDESLITVDDINRFLVTREKMYGKSASEIEALSSTPTAGVKYDQGKPRLDLLPDEAMEAIGRVMTFGAKKYAAHNWRKGLKYSQLVAALRRHVGSFMKGEDLDPESGESNIAHAGCCIMFLLTFIETKRTELDDRYKGK